MPFHCETVIITSTNTVANSVTAFLPVDQPSEKPKPEVKKVPAKKKVNNVSAYMRDLQGNK